jgi:sugar O-acyltransferase (sialic acid O-acetyltransferase NeuD family)
MNTAAILLAGAGGHARACIDVIEQEGRFALAGLVGLPHEAGTNVWGYPVLGTEADLPALLRDHASVLVAVGQIKTPDPRMRLFDLLQQHGAAFPVIVSPRAYVSPRASLGAGTIVMHGAIINAGATVGRNCILNSQSLVEHDSQIGDHCHISTNAAVNGGARIGAGTFIGSGTCVRECVSIGERCVIGMGQRIVADCANGTRVPENAP